MQRNKSIHINVQSNFIIPLKQTAINFLKPNFIFRSGRVPDLISLYVGMVKFFLFGIFFVICLLLEMDVGDREYQSVERSRNGNLLLCLSHKCTWVSNRCVSGFF